MEVSSRSVTLSLVWFLRSVKDQAIFPQTTASEGLIVICVAARARYLRQNPDAKLEDLVIYTTTQTHSLGVKAGLVLGLQVRALEVRKEDEYGLRGDDLRRALEEDIVRGRRPFIVGQSIVSHPRDDTILIDTIVQLPLSEQRTLAPSTI